MDNVEIHEFSTGIKGKTQGFTVGEYMNSTLREIPEPVVRAIGDELFALSEGACSNSPTAIGRVVPGNDSEKDWSVVALVTRGRDDRGETFSAYRYFLCEGRDRIWVILDWMEQYQQVRGRMPIFNPKESQGPGQQEIYMMGNRPKVNLARGWKNWISKESAPLIVASDHDITLQMINRMAHLKADGQPVSWAHRVEGLKKPETFIIIQGASERADAHLETVRDDLVVDTDLSPEASEAIETIELALRDLIGSSHARQDKIKNIVDMLENVEITRAQWVEGFNRVGAVKALMGNAHANDARLLTLRAIVLPETLPELLKWLHSGDERNQETPQQVASTKFQFQLRTNEYRRLEPFIGEGIVIALEQLIDRKLPVEPLAWLLRTDEGIWSKYRENLYENIRNDLQLISSSFGYR